LQLRHDLPQVALLLFDDEDEMRNLLSAVSSDEVLQPAFEIHFKRRG